VHKKVVDNLYVVACPIDVATNINIPLWFKVCFLFFSIFWLYVFWFYVSLFCIFFKFMFPFVCLIKKFVWVKYLCIFSFHMFIQQNFKISCFAFLDSRFFKFFFLICMLYVLFCFFVLCLISNNFLF
jgi:hypothetical protein